MKRGGGDWGFRDCGRRFPGSVSAIVYKGLGQNFPLFQSSLEIPCAGPSPLPLCHPVTVTLFLSHPSRPSSYPSSLKESYPLYPTLPLLNDKP